MISLNKVAIVALFGAISVFSQAPPATKWECYPNDPTFTVVNSGTCTGTLITGTAVKNNPAGSCNGQDATQFTSYQCADCATTGTETGACSGGYVWLTYST